MSSTDETKPATKSGRRNRKGEARRQKTNSAESPPAVEMRTSGLEQEPVPSADPHPTATEPFEAAVAEAMVAEPMAAEAEAVLSEAPSPAEPAAAPSSPVSLQTIANAYRDYTRKSFEEFGSFFEQLSGVRSLDKVMEVQTEFMKRACENAVAESAKIRELHRKLARQTFEPFRGFVGRAPETHGKP